MPGGQLPKQDDPSKYKPVAHERHVSAVVTQVLHSAKLQERQSVPLV